MSETCNTDDFYDGLPKWLLILLGCIQISVFVWVIIIVLKAFIE